MDQAASALSLAIDGRHGIDALNAVDFMPVRFLPVDAASFDITLDGSLSPTFHVWSTRSRSGFKTRPSKVTEVLTLRLPIRGRMRWRDRRDDYATALGQGFLLPFETLFEFEASPDFEVVSCTIPVDVVAEAHRALEREELLESHRFQPVIDLDTLPLRALSASLRHILRMMRLHAGGRDMTAALLSEVFVYQLLSAWPRLDSAAGAAWASASERPARLAREYIDAHLAQPISIAEIAGAGGVSVRTLQLDFRKAFDQTPMQYVIGARLDQVYLDLQGDRRTPVGEIARRWGFLHLSDFSRRYALRFGTTPAGGWRRNAT